MPLSPDVEKAMGSLGRAVRNWAMEVQTTIDSVATVVESPNEDNFASLDADGNIQDSGYDWTSFALASHNQAASTITDLKEKAVSLLASATLNGQTTTKQTGYTVPTGKTFIPVLIVFRAPSASLAGLVDMDIGGDASASDWLQEISLNAFTATTDFGEVRQPAQAAGPPIVPTKKTVYAAATVFGFKINTGSTGAATFKADIWGYLF